MRYFNAAPRHTYRNDAWVADNWDVDTPIADADTAPPEITP